LARKFRWNKGHVHAQKHAQLCQPRDFINGNNKLYRRNFLKHFRRLATRHDRRTIHFTGFVHLAAAMIRLR